MTAVGELEGLLATHALELIAGFGASSSMQPISSTSNREESFVVATIAFEAPAGTGGSVIIIGPRRSLRLIPLPDAKEDTAACDGLGELANLLAGWLKRYFQACGVKVRISTPQTGITKVVRTRLGDDPFPYCRKVVIDGAPLYIRVDADLGDAPLTPHASLETSSDNGMLFLEE